MGYWKNDEGEQELFSLPIKDVIEKWLNPDYKPYKCTQGKILSINIFSDVAAIVIFDCGGKFLDTHQMAKMAGSWPIAN